MIEVSNSQPGTLRNLLQIAKCIANLSRKFKHLANRQDELLDTFKMMDFTGRDVPNIMEGAVLLDELIGHEREVLALANGLSVTIRYWWRKSLGRMAVQLDGLESISDSFHAACDPEVRALLAFAVDHLSARK